ncbi:MAG TPA: nucleotidyltransferase family protein [Blastocatellia bacterium]|nr:nucleotidyltransferase family protein [Blastocatellia bacterium]
MSDVLQSHPPGRLIANLLTGAWRLSPDPPGVSLDELASIVPLLNASGAGPLAWWRVKNSSLRDAPQAQPLLEAYRYHTIQAIIHEINLKKVLALYRSNGIDPVLVKGGAIARLYPELGLRLYGDIDLCIPPKQYEAAVEVKRSAEGRSFPIDLHRGFEKLDNRRADELFARSEVVKIGEVEARVLCPEDHLRVLCLHTLRHGAMRPVWLIDIAVAFESRPDRFEWDICIGNDKRRADWIACSIGLAHRLLGVNVDDTPVARRAKSLPRWIVPSVLKLWSSRQKPHGIRTPMAHYLRHPAGLAAAIRLRWPNPIEATVDVNGPFNEWPRLPFQLGDCVVRTARFAAQLAGLRREA